VTSSSAADEEEANEIVEETLLSLTAANAQLEDLKNNLNNLLRRQGIAIVQETAKSKRADVVNDSEDEDDEEEDDDEDENQDEENDVNSLTHHQFNSPAAQINRKYFTAERNDDSNDIELSTV
jgi:DNA-directed RNA polymerase specialized sigma24 family protein